MAHALTRRAILAGGVAAFAAPLATPVPASASPRAATPITVTATPLPHFKIGVPDKVRFGALEYRSGLQLSANHADFGGFSGLWRSPDGGRLVAISDKGSWLTARLGRSNGRLTGLSEAVLAPILNPKGIAVARTRSFDTEGLAITPGGAAYVSIERTHEVLRFDFGKDGVKARGQPVPLPREVKSLPSNRSLEAIGVAPSGHPLAGAVVVIAERSGGLDDATNGWIVTGPQAGPFQVKRSDGFDITDLNFLPDGDMLILERWYQRWRGVKMRIRRIAARDLKRGALLDGPMLLEADMGHEVDNMEGLAIHQENGQSILTIISDDNFSSWQRTILLEFALVG
jgi:hypothetical protein